LNTSLILITQGDTNGIGLELFFRAIESNSITGDYVLISSKRNVLEYIDKIWDFNLKDKLYFIKDIKDYLKGKINILDCILDCEINKGKISAKTGLSSYNAVLKSIEILNNRKAHAVVTLPICKEAWYMNNIKYPGHTEVFGDNCRNSTKFTMILYSPEFLVSLVTIHEPLNKVSSLINCENVYNTIINTLDFSKKVYGKNAKVAVCSFNPHAGEGGYLGNEEKHIRKALDMVKSGYVIKQIFAADTLFYKVACKEINSVVCMYHDQGLIPFKMNNFETGVNITYGTEIIRTSPDHGTAFDITGTGKASIKSFVNAYKVAGKL